MNHFGGQVICANLGRCFFSGPGGVSKGHSQATFACQVILKRIPTVDQEAGMN